MIERVNKHLISPIYFNVLKEIRHWLDHAEVDSEHKQGGPNISETQDTVSFTLMLKICFFIPI